MLEKNNKYILQISIFYTTIFLLFILTPTYFYTKLELKQYKLEQEDILKEYSSKIEKNINDYLKSSKKSFLPPQSFKYFLILKNNKDEIIYKSFDKLPKTTFKKVTFLKKNRLNIKSITIYKKVSYIQIYLKISILIISAILFMFISIYFLIKASIEPYKKANQYLDNFFNDAMHELRTPLGVLQLNLEILNDKNRDQKEIRRCLNAIRNLFLIYEDIEYLSKKKVVIYNKEKIDFSYFLKHQLELFKTLIESKNIKLNLKIEDNIFININRTHLHRIVDNTISNAIKYSDQNQVIDISLSKEIFKVSNKGATITDVNKIFIRYYKEDNIKGGFGIGLNIVKTICDENKIEIEVVSKDNQTTFAYKISNILN